MTFPTQFNTQAKTIGSSKIKHPIYSFTVNLARFPSELIGPNTNQSSQGVLSPDAYQTDTNNGRTEAASRKALISTYLPGLLQAENVFINDDGTITAYGMKGYYIKKTYADCANPWLTVTNSPPYTSA